MRNCESCRLLSANHVSGTHFIVSRRALSCRTSRSALVPELVSFSANRCKLTSLAIIFIVVYNFDDLNTPLLRQPLSFCTTLAISLTFETSGYHLALHSFLRSGLLELRLQTTYYFATFIGSQGCRITLFERWWWRKWRLDDSELLQSFYQ